MKQFITNRQSQGRAKHQNHLQATDTQAQNNDNNSPVKYQQEVSS